MKTLLVKLMTPVLVVTGIATVLLFAAIKRIEEKYNDDYFWE